MDAGPGPFKIFLRERRCICPFENQVSSLLRRATNDFGHDTRVTIIWLTIDVNHAGGHTSKLGARLGFNSLLMARFYPSTISTAELLEPRIRVQVSYNLHPTLSFLFLRMISSSPHPKSHFLHFLIARLKRFAHVRRLPRISIPAFKKTSSTYLRGDPSTSQKNTVNKNA